MNRETHADPAEQSALWRLFYRDWRPTRVGRWANRVAGWSSALGLSSKAAVLEVRGRASGQRRSTPVVIASLDGKRYLVSMLGPGSDWVKNVEAADGHAVLRQGVRRTVRLVVVPPAERAPILREYVRVATSGRNHLPVAVGSPLSEFERLADRYPAYRIDPAWGAAAERGPSEERERVMTGTSNSRSGRSDAHQTRSLQIAGFLGPTLILLSISEAKNLQIWATGNPAMTYMAGLVWFLGGLTIVRLHNRWSMGWSVSITLSGWFFLLGGVFRMLLPEMQQGNQNTPALGIYATDLVLLLIGALLTLQGFRRSTAGGPLS